MGKKGWRVEEEELLRELAYAPENDLETVVQKFLESGFPRSGKEIFSKIVYSACACALGPFRLDPNSVSPKIRPRAWGPVQAPVQAPSPPPADSEDSNRWILVPYAAAVLEEVPSRLREWARRNGVLLHRRRPQGYRAGGRAPISLNLASLVDKLPAITPGQLSVLRSRAHTYGEPAFPVGSPAPSETSPGVPSRLFPSDADVLQAARFTSGTGSVSVPNSNPLLMQEIRKLAGSPRNRFQDIASEFLTRARARDPLLVAAYPDVTVSVLADWFEAVSKRQPEAPALPPVPEPTGPSRDPRRLREEITTLRSLVRRGVLLLTPEQERDALYRLLSC